MMPLPIITQCMQPLSLHLYSGRKPKKQDETQPSCDLAHPFVFLFIQSLILYWNCVGKSFASIDIAIIFPLLEASLSQCHHPD